MLKAVKYFFLIASLALLVIGHSPLLSTQVSGFFTGYAQRFGDLYQKCNLVEFKKEDTACGSTFNNTFSEGGNNLFLIGDSFFAGLDHTTDKFTNVKNVHYINWLDQLSIPALPARSKNILIIESVERGLLFNFGMGNIAINKEVPAYETNHRWQRNNLAKIVTIESDMFTLGQLLFSDRFSMTMKDMKASLNRSLFGRIDETVRLSGDKKYLYFNEETDGFISSFEPIRDGQVDSSVANYNAQYEHYKTMGFDEVYFTVIPNKVSIVEPNYKGREYNHFAERMKNHPAMKVPFIDMYSIMKKANETKEIFMRDDTHWNCEGKQLLIDYVNTTILNK